MTPSTVTTLPNTTAFEPVAYEFGAETAYTLWVRVTSVWESGSWLREALEAVSELASLGENWDGYGSPAIQHGAVETAVRLLSKLAVLEGLPAPGIRPVSGGGLQIELQSADQELEIEILPEGSLELLLSRAGEPVLELALPVEGLEGLRKLVGLVLR